MFTFEREGDDLVATVANPGTESLEGEIAIASPIETWPEAHVGPYSLMDISPRTIGFSLAPGEQREFRFVLSRQEVPVFTGWWVVAKLMVNGRIYLKKLGEKGPRHTWSSRRMWEAVSSGTQRLTS